MSLPNIAVVASHLQMAPGETPEPKERESRWLAVPAKGTADIAVDLLNNDEEERIRDGVLIEEVPLAFQVDGGFYATLKGAQGIGGSLSIEKAFLFGERFWGRDQHGFWIKPGMEADGQYDIRNGRLDRAHFASEPIVPYGLRMWMREALLGDHERISTFTSFFPLGFRYLEEAPLETKSASMTVGIMDLEMHWAVGFEETTLEIFGGVGHGFRFGREEICGVTSPIAYEINVDVGMGILLGEGIGVLRNETALEGAALMLPRRKGTPEKEKELTTSSASVSDRLSIEDIAGTGLGIFGKYALSYSAFGYSLGEGLNQKDFDEEHVQHAFYGGVGYTF